MKQSIVRCVCLSLILLLPACGSSPPNNHYLLTARHAEAPTADTPSLGIGPIVIPEYLNRNNLVYDQRDNKLQVSGTERWAEPLGDGLQRVIGLNLAQLVNTHNVRFFPWNSQRAPDYGVKVNLLTLDANDQQASLTAEWLVYKPSTSATIYRRITQLQQPLSAGELSPQQIAPAYSELLYQLSAEIAQIITAAEAKKHDPGKPLTP
jgi:uncharacterized lipoprotein YmbA